jgi:tRNA modification GTPase
MKNSAIIIYLFDAHELSQKDLVMELDKIRLHTGNSQVLAVCNKIDTEVLSDLQKEYEEIPNLLFISAKMNLYLEDLKAKLVAMFDSRTVNITETVVTNARHVDALKKANAALYRVAEGMGNNIQADFLAQDIRYSLEALGEITVALQGSSGQACLG